jgi:UPF0755 protein
MKRLLIVFVALITAGVLGGLWWVQQPLPIPPEGLSVNVPPGASVGRITRDLEAKGVIPNARLAQIFARVWNVAPTIQAGVYNVDPPQTLRSLFAALTDGKAVEHKLTIVEGTTLKEMIELINKAPHFKDDAKLTRDRIAESLQIPMAQLEGQFFPDTYHYVTGSDPMSVVRKAHLKLKAELDRAWENKKPDLPYANATEMLIMASIIEKETNAPKDREKVASVFVNRQRIGMRLQTDPTVIYGLGDKFDGNLTRAHLQADTPYNTYTRAGFPPTPIALAGRAALEAAANPAQTKLMYFVARGDGTSEFSETLDQHNRAVAKFQLGK